MHENEQMMMNFWMCALVSAFLEKPGQVQMNRKNKTCECETNKLERKGKTCTHEKKERERESDQRKPSETEKDNNMRTVFVPRNVLTHRHVAEEANEERKQIKRFGCF